MYSLLQPNESGQRRKDYCAECLAEQVINVMCQADCVASDLFPILTLK